jgi:hypothetical protein
MEFRMIWSGDCFHQLEDIKSNVIVAEILQSLSQNDLQQFPDTSMAI